MKSKDLALCALFAALMAVCAWISLPVFGVPITLQTFGLFLALLTLGGKRGTIAFTVYLCLGAAGLPIFSGFGGGVGVLFGATGGFLWGFLASCLIYWLVTTLLGARFRLFSVILGLIVCYICGGAWFTKMYTGGGNPIMLGVVPFILPDAVKITLAWLVAKRLRKHLP